MTLKLITWSLWFIFRGRLKQAKINVNKFDRSQVEHILYAAQYLQTSKAKDIPLLL